MGNLRSIAERSRGGDYDSMRKGFIWCAEHFGNCLATCDAQSDDHLSTCYRLLTSMCTLVLQYANNMALFLNSANIEEKAPRVGANGYACLIKRPAVFCE